MPWLKRAAALTGAVVLVLTAAAAPAHAATTQVTPGGGIKGALVQNLVFSSAGTTTCTSSAGTAPM